RRRRRPHRSRPAQERADVRHVLPLGAPSLSPGTDEPVEHPGFPSRRGRARREREAGVLRPGPGSSGGMIANASIVLRLYRDTDEEAALAIWWDSWHSIRPGLRHPRPFADWRARWVGEIVPEQSIVVADDDGLVVGFAAAHLPARELT